MSCLWGVYWQVSNCSGILSKWTTDIDYSQPGTIIGLDSLNFMSTYKLKQYIKLYTNMSCKSKLYQRTLVSLAGYELLYFWSQIEFKLSAGSRHSFECPRIKEKQHRVMNWTYFPIQVLVDTNISCYSYRQKKPITNASNICSLRQRCFMVRYSSYDYPQLNF